MTALTCWRCGLTDARVVARVNTRPHHVRQAQCISALKAIRGPLGKLRAVFASGKVADVMLTFGNPEFGIECTVLLAADRDTFATATNAPDGVTAILLAYEAACRRAAA